MKRLLILALAMSVVATLAWWLLAPAPLALAVDQRYQAFGVLHPRRTAGLTCPRSVLTALTYCAPQEKRAATFAQLLRALESGAERADFGFATDRSEPVILVFDPGAPSPASPRLLPAATLLQLRTLEHGYLLVRFEPAGALLELAAKRRWLETPVAEIARGALSATIAVGEQESPNLLVASLALEYRTSEEAESALRKLTAGEGAAAGYVAQPFSRTLVRQTKIVTILYQVNADLAVQALNGR